MTPEEYKAKRLAKQERLEARAEKRRADAATLWEQAHKMGEAIPFGQPILVGHHSERADRNRRERIWNKQSKSVQLSREADTLERRAKASAANTAIFSDDPNAAEKLEDKITRLEQRQERMKATNKLVRKNDREGLLDLGYSEQAIDALFKPDFAGRTGYPDYLLTNNSAEIRRLKQRLQQIQAHRADQTSEREINGVRIVDNVEENRLQMFFPTKPAAHIRALLKSHGFRLSPSQGCWQARRGPNAQYWSDQIARQMP